MNTNLAPNVKSIQPVRVLIEQEQNLEPAKLRVAAYARVSTEQDEQQSSYEAQVKYYTNYIQNNPSWEFVGVFAEENLQRLPCWEEHQPDCRRFDRSWYSYSWWQN